MANNPFFSIIIPSYNQGNFIDKCLQSILNQTFLDYEVIVQDNNSKDNTKSILEKYKEFRNFHIYFERDKGQADAINKGIKKAKGKWLTWQNCDDYYFSKEVFYIVHDEIILDKKNKYGLFYGNMNLVYLNENYESELRFYGVNRYTLALEGMILSNQSCFWNKNLHINYGYLRNFFVSFDYEWFLRISEHVKFKKIRYQLPISSFLIYKFQKSYKYSEYNNSLRSRIVKLYLMKFNLPKNFILIFILSKLSKLYRFIVLITVGDLGDFLKKKFKFFIK